LFNLVSQAHGHGVARARLVALGNGLEAAGMACALAPARSGGR